MMYTYMIQQRRKVLGSASPITFFAPLKTPVSYESENGDVGDVDVGSYVDAAVVEPPATGRKGRKKAKAL
jgi:hypothetical protein